MPFSSFRFWVFVLFGLCLALPISAADTAERSFQQARKLVSAGDLSAARSALVSAVRADKSNQKYLQQYLLVTQAIKLQNAVKTEKDARRWESAAQSLSLFYTSQDLPAQALTVDELIFARLKTADAAVQLAETLLKLKQPKRAAEVLGSVSPKQATAASQALLGIALKQQGDARSAEGVVASLRVPAKADAFTLYLVARAQAAVGEEAKSLETLTLCYESVTPSRLGALKTHTKQCSEFAGLSASPTFARVLQTESKVPESKCSGGSSCSTCPMRGSCSHD